MKHPPAGAEFGFFTSSNHVAIVILRSLQGNEESTSGHPNLDSILLFAQNDGYALQTKQPQALVARGLHV